MGQLPACAAQFPAELSPVDVAKGFASESTRCNPAFLIDAANEPIKCRILVDRSTTQETGEIRFELDRFKLAPPLGARIVNWTNP